MWRILILGSVLGLLASCSGPLLTPGDADSGSSTEGDASFNSTKHQGKRTASGEPFDQNQLTAAHRTLPFDTRVRVTNLRNGKSVIVRINDRGPYTHGRIIDLSRKAAQQLDMISAGVAPVRVEVVD